MSTEPLPTRAWKFLDDRGRGMVSGFPWPIPISPGAPGEWVDAGGPIEACACGIHACGDDDLAWWLSAQLWEVELDGEQLRGEHTLVAGRGRLLNRLDQWPTIGPELATWAIWRSRDLAADILEVSEVKAAEAIRGASTIDELTLVVNQLPKDVDRPQGVAVALMASQLCFPTNPVLACVNGAQGAAHAAIVADPAADTRVAFAQERTAQSRWLVDRLGLVS